jgi:hypothetical protein
MEELQNSFTGSCFLLFLNSTDFVQALLNDICFLLKRPEEHNHVKLRASYK